MQNRTHQTARHASQFQELCYLPGYTVMVFVRRKIGLRLLSPLRLLRAAILLYFYSQIGVYWLHGSLLDLRLVEYFDAAFLLFATAHYIRSWRSFNRGDKGHSFSSGFSHLEAKLRLPRFLRRNRHIYRTLDPLLVAVTGLCLLKVSLPLALWLIASALSLQSFEQARYLAVLTRDIDIVDGLTEAEIQQQTVEYFRPKATTSNPLSSSADALQTGIGPDIEPQIARRRKGGDQSMAK